MFQRWDIPTYITQFIKREPNNIFQELLKDENIQSSTEKYKVQDRLTQSKQLLNAASKIIKEYISQLEKEGKTGTRNYQLALRIRDIINSQKTIIKEIEQGKVVKTDYAVLSSSWLHTSIISFTTQNTALSSTAEEIRDYIDALIAMVSSLLSQITSFNLNLILPLLYIRKSLMILLNIPINYKEGEVGELSYRVLKRYNPKRIYGPYKEFSLPVYVWELMKKAIGSYGTGAGTILHRWRKRLI